MTHDQAPEPQADDISLRPYVDAVWRYRRVIGALVAGTAVLFILGAVLLYLRSPVERVANLQFRLLFAGASSGKYPNGQPFNPTEIVSPPVISEVFAANDLGRYGKLQDFQTALFLLHSNLALQQLDYSYQAKLSDTRLTPVDRTRIEEEFMRKREAISTPEYTLSLRRNERFRKLPETLMEKVLSDTLDTWARQADAAKGIARPDVSIVSRDVLARAELPGESLLVRVDVLRSAAHRLLGALNALEKVPGAPGVRTSDNRGLADEKATVEDIIRFDLEPLMGLARGTASAGADRPLLQAYVANQIGTHTLDQRTAAHRAVTLQTSLRDYMAQRGSRVEPASGTASQQAAGQQAAMPQVGDAFIDRLMEMSAASQREELQYRQSLTDKYIKASDEAAAAEREVAYYEELKAQLTSPSLSLAGNGELLTARFDATRTALAQSIDRVRKLYDEISLQTLNPARRLYTITQPVRVQSTSSIAWDRIFLFFLLTLSLAALGGTAACLVYNSVRTRAAERAHHRPVEHT